MRPAFRLAAAGAAFALAAVACRDGELTGPGIPRRVSLRVAPSLAALQDAPVRIGTVEATVVDEKTNETVANRVVQADAASASITIELSFTVADAERRFTLRLRALDTRGEVLFTALTAGIAPAVAGVGTPPTIRPELVYVGRDTIVATVRTTVRDTVLHQGTSATLRASAAASNDSTVLAAIFWRSRDTSRVRVGVGDGRVSAGTLTGAAWVVAHTLNEKRDSVRVTVLPAVTTIVAVPESATVSLGRSTRLSATALDAAGAPIPGSLVHWSTADGAIASVDAAGLVTGRALGRVLVNASVGGRTRGIPVRVVPAPVSRVRIAPRAVSVRALETTPLAAATYDDAGAELTGRPVAWRTLDPAIATMDAATGAVRGVTEGQTFVVASSEGAADTVPALVQPARVAAVRLADSAAVARDDTVRLLARVEDVRGGVLSRPVAFASSDPAAASVDAAGLVTAHRAHVSLLVIATAEGLADTARVRTLPKAVDTVVVSQGPSVTVAVGRTLALTATPLDRDRRPNFDHAVDWGSAAPPVATVSSGGQLRGVAEGATAVTASAGGRATTVRVGVTAVPIASVGVEPRRSTLALGDSLQLYVGGRDSTGRLVLVYPAAAVTWQSLDGAVATVTAQGLVRPVAAGQARIRVSGEGRVDTASVTVVPAALGFAAASVGLAPGQKATALLTLSVPPNAPLTVALSSADPSVASVPATVRVDSGVRSVPVTVVGHAVGSVVLTANAPGYAAGTVTAGVEPGTLTVGGWPSSLAAGDSALVTIYLASAGGQTRTAAVPVTLAFEAPAHLAFTNGFAAITSATVRAGATGVQLFLVARSSGSGAATIRAAGYADRVTPAVSVP